MKGLLLLSPSLRAPRWDARDGLARLLGFGRDALLALWAVSVLAFCAVVAAGVML